MTSEDEVRSKAWKHVGYSGFSAWIASSNDFFHVRRFGAVGARSLLWMQDQITRLEERLEEIDSKLRRCPEDFLGRNDSFRFDSDPRPLAGHTLAADHKEREEIMRALYTNLKSYCESYFQRLDKSYN